ncbi:hypothetical protein J6590_001193 [Homalodisca vitripennis]|nr:hypothetical protein J6590_001193 [Homalodisca vitripennis]
MFSNTPEAHASVSRVYSRSLHVLLCKMENPDDPDFQDFVLHALNTSFSSNMNDEAFDSDLDRDDILINNIGEDSDNDDDETGMEVDTTDVSPFSEDPQPSTSTAPTAMRNPVTVPRPDSGATPQCDLDTAPLPAPGTPPMTQ